MRFWILDFRFWIVILTLLCLPSACTRTVVPQSTIPTGTEPPAVEIILPPLGKTTTWDLPAFTNINNMRNTIIKVLQANELEFDLGYPVQGFKPDPVYPRLFIRDTSTLMMGASYLYPTERLKWGIEGFLRQQYTETTVSSEDGWSAGVGAISATVGPDGKIDKATTVSDEETHFIHAAFVVYQVNGGVDWLKSKINGVAVINRLNSAGNWLLTHRRDETTRLIKRDHTTDWGDVRFQPTEGNPTDIVQKDVVWTASIYDQALAYRAWRELAEMNRTMGNETTAQSWDVEAEKLHQATNTHLWQPERGFYRTHLHLTPLQHNFDEDAMVSIANAVAIVCGLTNSSQNARIIVALKESQWAAGAYKAGVVLYPPYPQGFFVMPTLARPGAYQNGGIWDWWGGWQLLAEFEDGYSELGRDHLLQTANDWDMHPDQIFEWQELNLTGQGGDQYAGAAGIYTQVVVEGLYGVRLSRFGLTLSPRLGDWSGNITVHQPPSGLYLRYAYQPSADYLALAYDTNTPESNFPLHLLLPYDFKPAQVWLDKDSQDWNQVTLGQDTYLNVSVPSGQHLLVVKAVTP